MGLAGGEGAREFEDVGKKGADAGEGEAARQVGGGGGEDVAAVEGLAEAGEEEGGVLEAADVAAGEGVEGEGENAVVGAEEQVAVGADRQRAAAASHSGVHDDHMDGARGEVAPRGRQGEGPGREVAGADRMGEVNDVGLGGEGADDPFHGADEPVVEAEVGGEGDGGHGGLGGQADVLFLALDELAVVGEPAAGGQVEGGGKVRADLGRMVRIRAKSQGEAVAGGQVEEMRTGIDFPAVFTEPSGVDFDGDVSGLGRAEEPVVEGRAVTVRAVAEFLREVGVPDDVEEAGGGGLGEEVEVLGPDFEDIAAVPLVAPVRVVDVPGGVEVMDGADEVIPGMAPAQFADPIFAAGQVVHFEGEADGEGRVGLARLFNLGDVGVELVGAHAPVVEVVFGHGVVVGEADFGQAGGEGTLGEFGGGAGGVAAQRGVHVVIGR